MRPQTGKVQQFQLLSKFDEEFTHQFLLRLKSLRNVYTAKASAANAAPPAATSAPNAASNDRFEGPVIPMCVYLHNKTVIMMEIEDTPSATCELICQAIVNSEELGLNKQLAAQVFTLWMISPILEIQLKPYSKPYEMRQNWRNLIEKYGHASEGRMEKDEPKLVFQRNIFVTKQLEERIKDQKILELLYEECKYNVLNGRYPSEIAYLIMLGGIQAREELGPYNLQVHTTHFFREQQSKFLPAHVRKSPTWTWLPISSKSSAEVRLLEQFKRIPSTATNKKLMKKYLEYCWGLPFYGAAFFEGQIEEPVRGLISLLTHQDVPVLLAINPRGLYIIDDLNCQIVLGLRYEEFSWDCSKPSREDNPDCLPCLFVQFLVVENGARVSKMLQVFSRQATLMDTLITSYVSQVVSKSNDEVDNKMCESQSNSDNDNHNPPGGAAAPPYSANHAALSTKLSKLTLATFDDEGHCIGQMGSWSFSY
ncbi:FERM domain-containing protein 8 isoform X2 [Dendroctonus ponderosae]|uniref:FERM domain-containing protein 8-like n=1 Tax=Dendroctonus ponderosae TaxID=77166 RepID=UPI0020361B64|nr:FERM domain-containing protein 8-like [Dendroctonus ponderosae]XP_048518018.1 FERM domain-containing protein 8 isoform X2 [Dendroctonus ponderosae]